MSAGYRAYETVLVSAGEPARDRIDTLLCAALLFWLIAGTFMQDYFFRLVPVTLAAFALLTFVSARFALRSEPAFRVDGPFPALYVLLAAMVFALLLSLLEYPAVTSLPRAERFILRQAYIVAVLPMALITGLILWRNLYTWLYEFCARHFILLAIAFITADIATAYFFGNPLFRSINGYSQFADKLVGSFLFIFLYMARVTHPEKGSVLTPLSVLVGYYGATKFLTYGSLFQATTGTIVALLLAAVTLLRARPVLTAQLSLLGLFAFSVVLIAGTVSPELFAGDFNAYWRFSNWQANFRTLYDTAFLGIGFGTPYFPITTEELQHALTILKRGADPWTSSAQTYDLVFMRAQHNSFVNMFYRTGLVGGTAFLLFNLTILRGLLHGIACGNRRMQCHCVLALVVMVNAILQALLHVGLETPGFLVAYGVWAALGIQLTPRPRVTEKNK